MPDDVFRFPCLNCGKKLKAKSELAGKRGACSGCGSVFVVPQVVQYLEADDSVETPSMAVVDRKEISRTGLTIFAVFLVVCMTKLFVEIMSTPIDMASLNRWIKEASSSPPKFPPLTPRANILLLCQYSFGLTFLSSLLFLIFGDKSSKYAYFGVCVLALSPLAVFVY